jgi:hypothetical protein
VLPKCHRNCCCRRCGITTLARVSQFAILSKYKAQAAWVHLKSNLITHGDREAENPKNIQKREIAITQLLTHIHDVVSTTMPTVKRIVIGGDFNTNHDQAMFAAERTLNSVCKGSDGHATQHHSDHCIGSLACHAGFPLILSSLSAGGLEVTILLPPAA